MDDPHRHGNLPIPSYEEAISSRPSSAFSPISPEESSHDAERRGLLAQFAGPPRGQSGYRPPTVESVRSSVDSDLYLPEVDGEDEADLVRRDMEEMEVMDTDHSPSRLRSGFTKPFSYFTHSLSSIRFSSFRIFPRSWSCPIPRLPEGVAIPLSVLARLLGLAIIILSVWLLVHFNIILPNRHRMSRNFDPEAVRSHVQSVANAERIRDILRYITSFDHVAGTEGDLVLAKWVHDAWKMEQLDKVDMLEYQVYLNYPTPAGRKVSILNPPELRWDAKLEEENVLRASGQARQQTAAWHGSSRSGKVTGHLIYANGGSRADFQALKDMGINVKGSIVLVRHHATQHDPALKVKAAEMAGAAGCLIYSDPMDDGYVRGTVYPDGPWQPSDAVQRGSVGLTSWVLGDYLTPGHASDPKAGRKSEKNNPGLNNIPSLPLAWRDAQKLLQSLNGKGKKVPENWVGKVVDVPQWWTGADDGPTVLLQNLQDENKHQNIWNVRGIIEGVESPDNRVLVGNHRDSWCFGAVDPGSGSAIMMEVVQIFGKLVSLGWRPLRTIEFLSWDAKEFNMMGSTEFVEGHLDALRKRGIGYLNVDAGVSGSEFSASASPLYQRMIMHVLNRVDAPYTNKTVKTLWDERQSKVKNLGSAGDTMAFQDLAGVASLDFGFRGVENGYPYHSCYDTFEWMEKHADAEFGYHRAMAQIWALLILELADRPILPFDINAYAAALHTYIDQLGQDSSTMGLDLAALKKAAFLLEEKARSFHHFEDYWTVQVLGGGGLENREFAAMRMEYNEKLVAFEKNLLDLPGMFPGDEKEPHGIPGREQYKHVIFGPPGWSEHENAGFPAVRDAIESGSKEAAQAQVNKAARIIERAAQKLEA